MNIKYLIPFLFLLILFAAISLLVFLTAGKNSFLLSKKLKIGAWIVVVSAMLWGKPLYSEDDAILCYKPALSSSFQIDKVDDGKIVIMKENIVISGTVVKPSHKTYYYKIINNKSKVVAEGTFSFMKNTQKLMYRFIIKPDVILTQGNYIFKIFYKNNKEMKVVESYSLIVK